MFFLQALLNYKKQKAEQSTLEEFEAKLPSNLKKLMNKIGHTDVRNESNSGIQFQFWRVAAVQEFRGLSHFQILNIRATMAVSFRFGKTLSRAQRNFEHPELAKMSSEQIFGGTACEQVVPSHSNRCVFEFRSKDERLHHQNRRFGPLFCIYPIA